MEEKEHSTPLVQEGMQIGVIGDRDSVLGFMALGYTVCEASDLIQAEHSLTMLCADPRYAVIFITEEYAKDLTHLTDRYRSRPLPAIVTIPGAHGKAAGYGMAHLHRAVERAVGADILS